MADWTPASDTAPGAACGAITGAVHTSDGWPVTHAVVTVTDGAGRQAARVPVAEDASFTVPALASGAYTVIITAAGYQPAARTAVVAAGRQATLGELALARVDGLVLPPEGEWEIDPIHSAVQATAYHIGLSKVHGRFTQFSGRIQIAEPPEGSSVDVVIEAGSIDTNNEQRDAHLRSADFLYVERFPTITFHGEKVERISEDRWSVTGPLTLREVARPVVLDVTYLGSGPDPWGGTRAGFSATTRLTRDDYAMSWNQAVTAGIAVFGRTLRVDIDIQAVRA